MIKRRNVAIGTLLVAGIAYAAGVLTAPKSGRETRRDLRRSALKAKNEAERTLKNTHSELTRLITQANAKLQASKTKVSAEFKTATERAEAIKQKTREVLSAMHEGEADDHDLEKAVTEVRKSIDHLKRYLQKPAHK